LPWVSVRWQWFEGVSFHPYRGTIAHWMNHLSIIDNIKGFTTDLEHRRIKEVAWYSQKG